MDFENAFNSVSHENLWAVLRSFEIPDIDLLEAIYSVATVSLAHSQGKGDGVTFDTGVLESSRGRSYDSQDYLGFSKLGDLSDSLIAYA